MGTKSYTLIRDTVNKQSSTWVLNFSKCKSRDLIAQVGLTLEKSAKNRYKKPK